MENYFYVTINKINGKRYYGSGSNYIYLGSGIDLDKARKKYGDENFELTKLKFFKTREEAFKFEDRFLKLYDIRSLKDTYNKCNNAFGGDTWTGRSHTEESKNKSRESNLKTWSDSNLIEKHSKMMKDIWKSSGRKDKSLEYWTDERKKERSDLTKSKWNEDRRSSTSKMMKVIKMKKVVCEGVEYESISKAMDTLNISWHLLTKKFNDEQITNWYKL